MINLDLFFNPSENIYVLEKWNWDYLEAEKFQLECVDFVHENPHISILIICSHPHCFTLGRGLQKVKGTTSQALVDFVPETELPFPLYNIKRGGGLTFHYPGQFVFYPILSLTFNKLAVYDLMLKIMDILKNIIQNQFFLSGLEIKKVLLGLWFENEFLNAKLASIGLAVNRYNTYHGLALNLYHDEAMFGALRSIHPCGLPGDIYRSLEFLMGRQITIYERELLCSSFLDLFMEYLKPNYLIIDKQRSSSIMIDSISEEVCL